MKIQTRLERLESVMCHQAELLNLAYADRLRKILTMSELRKLSDHIKETANFHEILMPIGNPEIDRILSNVVEDSEANALFSKLMVFHRIFNDD